VETRTLPKPGPLQAIFVFGNTNKIHR